MKVIRWEIFSSSWMSVQKQKQVGTKQTAPRKPVFAIVPVKMKGPKANKAAGPNRRHIIIIITPWLPSYGEEGLTAPLWQQAPTQQYPVQTNTLPTPKYILS